MRDKNASNCLLHSSVLGPSVQSNSCSSPVKFPLGESTETEAGDCSKRRVSPGRGRGCQTSVCCYSALLLATPSAASLTSPHSRLLLQSFRFVNVDGSAVSLRGPEVSLKHRVMFTLMSQPLNFYLKARGSWKI